MGFSGPCLPGSAGGARRRTLHLYPVPFARCRSVRARPARDIQRVQNYTCLLHTSPSPRDRSLSRMPSSA
eukprot:2328383-Pyramimonas_sp.AAC.1